MASQNEMYLVVKKGRRKSSKRRKSPYRRGSMVASSSFGPFNQKSVLPKEGYVSQARLFPNAVILGTTLGSSNRSGQESAGGTEGFVQANKNLIEQLTACRRQLSEARRGLSSGQEDLSACMQQSQQNAQLQDFLLKASEENARLSQEIQMVRRGRRAPAATEAPTAPSIDTKVRESLPQDLEQIKSLQADIEALKRQNDTVARNSQNVLRTSQSTIASLQKDYDACKRRRPEDDQELLIIKRDLEQQKIAADALRSSLAAAESRAKEIEQVRVALAEKEVNTRGTLLALQQTHKELQAAYERLQGMCQTCLKESSAGTTIPVSQNVPTSAVTAADPEQVSQLTGRIKSLEKERDALQVQLEELRKVPTLIIPDRAQVVSQIDTLQKQYQDVQKEKKVVLEELQAVQKDLKASQLSKDQVQARFKEVQDRLQASEAQVLQLETAAKENLAKATQAAKTIKETMGQNSSALDKVREEAERRFKLATEAQEAAEASRKELQFKYDSLLLEKNEREQKLLLAATAEAGLRERMEQLEREKQALQVQAKEYEERIKNLSLNDTLISDLKKSLEQLTSDKERLLGQLSTLDGTRADEKKALLLKIRQLEGERNVTLTTFQKEKDVLREAAEGREKALQAQVDDLTRKIKESQDSFQRKEKEAAERLRQVTEDFQQRLTSGEKAMNALQSDLEDQRKRLSEEKSACEQRIAAIQESASTKAAAAAAVGNLDTEAVLAKDPELQRFRENYEKGLQDLAIAQKAFEERARLLESAQKSADAAREEAERKLAADKLANLGTQREYEARLRETIKEYDAKLASVNMSRETLQRQVAEAEREIQTLRANLSKKENSSGQAASQEKAALLEKEEALRKLQVALRDRDAAIQEKEKALGDSVKSKQSLAKVSTSLSEVSAARDAAMREVQSAREALRERQMAHEGVLKERETALKELQMARQNTSSLNAERDAAVKKAQEATRRLEESTRQVQEAKQKAQEAIQEAARNAAENAARNATEAAAAKHEKSLRELRDQYESRLRTLQEAKETFDGRVRDLQGQMQEQQLASEKRLEEARRNVALFKGQFEEQLRKVRDSKKEYEARLAGLNQEILGLRKAAEDQGQRARAELDRMRAACDQRTAELTRARDSLDARSRELLTENQRLQAAEQKYVGNAEALKQIQAAYEKLQEQHKALGQGRAQVEARSKELEVMQKSLQDRLSALTAENASIKELLEQRTAEGKEAVESMRKRFMEEKEALEKTRQELSKSIEDLKRENAGMKEAMQQQAREGSGTIDKMKKEYELQLAEASRSRALLEKRIEELVQGNDMLKQKSNEALQTSVRDREEALAKTREAAESRIAALQAAYDAHSQKIKELTELNAKAVEEGRRGSGAFQVAQEGFAKERAGLLAEVARLKDLQEACDKRVSVLVEQNKVQVASSQSRVGEVLRQQKEVLEQERQVRDTCSARVQELQTEVSRVRAEAEKAVKEAALAARQGQVPEDRLRDAMARAETADGKLQEMEKALAGLREQLVERERRIEALQSATGLSSKEAEARIADLNERLAAQVKETIAVKAQLASRAFELKEKLGEQEKALEEKAKALAEAGMASAGLDEQLRALKEATARQQEVSARQQEGLSTVSQEKESLQVQLAEARKQLEAAAMALKSERQECQLRIAELEKARDTAGKDLETLRGIQNDRDTRTESIQSTLEAAQGQLAERQKLLEKAIADLRERDARLEQMESRHQQAIADAVAAAVRNTEETVRAQCKANDAIVSRCDSEKMSIRQEFEGQLDALKRQNDGLNAQISDLMGQLKSLSSQKASASAAVAEVCDNLRSAIRDINKYIEKKVRVIDRIESSLGKPGAAAPDDPGWQVFKQNHSDVFTLARSVISSFPDASADCSQVQKMYETALKVQNELLKFDNDLTNLYEDVSGAVRVYVKFRPLTGYKDGTAEKVGKFVQFRGSSCGQPDERFGPFFGVMSGDFTNPDVYNGCTGTTLRSGSFTIEGESCCAAGALPAVTGPPSVPPPEDPSGVCRVFEQLKSGYHVILFGYGTSGSGKTFTLLGSPEKRIPGLVHLAIANLGANVSVDAIYEMTYAGQVDTTLKNGMKGQVIELIGGDPLKMREAGIKTFSESSDFPLKLGSLIDKTARYPKIRGNLTPQDMFSLTSVLTQHRTTVKTPRVKATQNNPESSRSHLFITMSFKFEKLKKTGYLTVVDMAGVESPYDILNSFYDKIGDRPDWSIYAPSFVGKGNPLPTTQFRRHVYTTDDPRFGWYPGDKASFVRSLNSYSEVDIRNIVQEGFFINESINQLVYYFKEKNKVPLNQKNNTWEKGALVNYDPNLFYAGSPKTEIGQQIGMYKLLKALESYKGAKSKFVMMCLTRLEPIPQYCQNTRSTLVFADSVKSS